MAPSRSFGSGTLLPGVTALVVLLTVGLGPVSAFAATEQLTVNYSFERPEISEVTIEGQRYHRVTLPGCSNGGIADQPALPARGARILIPMGAKVSSIEIVAGEKVLLGSDYLIEPVGRQVRLSARPTEVIPPTPDPAIYGSDRPFPGTQFEEIGTHGFRGYQILVLKLHPVQYVPTSGELYYYPDLTVVVGTAETSAPAALFRGLPVDAQEAAAKVDNPEVVGSYAAAGERDERHFDLLILSTPSLASAFQPLKDFHDTYGTATEIHTTDDVGSTDPIEVRDYIKDRYLNDGVTYVIIGADDDIIPAKDLYVDGINDMPGDIFFACLDGSWNYDGDSRWGEPTDGEGGGDVDMVAEVYVGRASVGDTTEAGRFVDKTLWYLTGQHSTSENVLLVGEYLGFGGIAEWGGNYLDELIDGSSEHGYTTVGFPSDLFNIDTLYERDGAWSKSDLTAIINDTGLHALNHLGHGDTNYAMKLYSSDILTDLTNDDLCFVYSQTCLAGHLDGMDCWAEYIHIKIDYGAFAVVMNARYGYGQFYSTDGASQRFNREFWDAIFDEQLTELGRANQDSKEDNIYRVNDDYMRWCLYELNLFGDPTVVFRGACTDAGTATLDSAKYACQSTATITVNDCGLNTDDGVAESVVVDIDSDSETGVEQVTLVETAPTSAKFTGSIDLDTTNSPGVLLVAEGDTVTVTYNDADDGTGNPAVVTATALVDCTPPSIWNIQVINIEPRSATVTFDADETVRGTVQYGLSCDSLTESATGNYGNPASVGLTGLQDNTTYYFIVVAEDQAGNQVTDDNGGACYSFTTPEVPDFFTEEFGSDNDLDYLTLLFTPNGSVDYYGGCTEEIDSLPTDPSGGTPLSISEDSYQIVYLDYGATVPLYGVSHSSFYVCDNGYITFGSGDSDYTESLEDHFDMPRISLLFDDLSVDNYDGFVSWKQEADRAVVTYENVPEYGTSNNNTFQVEMYFNGDIRISYLALDADDGLAGLSEGNGLDPDYYPSDLSAMGSCGPRPPTAENDSVTTEVNIAVTITLTASDDGLPEPPALDYIIVSLPANGTLSDPGAGIIDSVPYTLVGGGNLVQYDSDPDYIGLDSFTFKANDGGTPPEGGDSNVATIEIEVTPPVPHPVYDFPLDTDPGWSVEGQWAFGQPTGGGSHNGDPSSGYTGSNVYGYNLNGDYAVSIPAYYLTSTAIDCSNLLYVELRFWRWLGVESCNFDHATVEVSNDGSAWTVLWENPLTSISDISWSQMVFDLSAIADGEPTVYLRWSMGPTDPSVTYPGWNIDDIEIWATVAECPGDLDGDNDVDLADLAELLANYGTTSGAVYEDGDLDGDGDVDLADLAELLSLYGTTC